MTRENPSRSNRRRFLIGTAALGAAGVAGCTGLFGDNDDDGTEDNESDSSTDQIGYDREGRDAPGGTPMEEMPPLEGELTVYSGRGEFLVGDLVEYIQNQYEEFSLNVRYGNSSDLVNQIITEGSGTPADVFYSVNAGSLGALADEGRTQSLPDDLLELIREEFHADDWIGTSGRARTVPYNTEVLSADDMSDSIDDYSGGFEGSLGWAPSYGSCQAFVTAMRLLRGEEATREWLEGVMEAGISDYPDEFAVCQAIADGEIDAGFTNHYYIQRVLDGSPDAPIEASFTEGDAGAIFNVAGATVTDAAADADLGVNFIRHLLSAEAQDYFARTTFEYPLIPEVEPIGDLPTIDELNPPSELDLTQLSDLEPTINMMRDVGIDV